MQDFYSLRTCDRCSTSLEGKTRTLSRMNMDVLCADCALEERQHPKYKEACEKEREEYIKGNRNYRGLFDGQKYPFRKGRTATE